MYSCFQNNAASIDVNVHEKTKGSLGVCRVQLGPALLCLCVGECGEVSVSGELEVLPCPPQCESTSGFPGLPWEELLR